MSDPALQISLPGQAPTLEYAYHHQQRPGLVSAMGIVSIVLGSLGILASAWGLISTAAFLAMGAYLPAGPGMGGGVAFTPAGVISDADAAVIVAALDSVQPLGEADAARLAQALPLVNFPLAPPPEGQPWTAQHVTSQIVTSSSGAVPGPTVDFQFQGNGHINIGPREITVVSIDDQGGFNHASVGAGGAVTSTAFAGINPFIGRSDPGPMVATVATELLSLGAAILLLVAGILTLHSSVRSVRLHRIWAWSKLAIVVLATGSGIWWSMTFVGGFGGMQVTTTGPGAATATATPGPPQEMMIWFMILATVFMGLLTAIYPVAVLILLRTRTVRNYFAQAGPD